MNKLVMKKIFKITVNILFYIVTIGLLILLSISFFSKDNLVKIGKYSLLDVQGTSMYPELKHGDLIAIDRTKKDKYEKGDIVSFVMDDGTIITHEIIKVLEGDDGYHYYTKGTNNNYQDNDYIEIKQIVGEYKGFRVPIVGYIVEFAESTIGYIILVILPLGGILGYFIWQLVIEIRKKEGVI